ncbi:rho GTPase-activating protein SYDE1 [Latimeria chalumnae]|uniref:rho GTPase-activating protein SYDE1 n=1 Tax=Latimeria chalumnae TaxID=7897 RepID=UPI0003C136C2|nr:PREDICTED: rho GTPase-activating protein SYDE1 [Latimeria chalumnae]|eukprot:XP_006002980.1 PREDICTED: rho GTPase-activating protein SYDE1 [Latimeria chalumnae]
MAEPLLRKTFSRLRGKEKLKRKKSDLKERDPIAKAEATKLNPLTFKGDSSQRKSHSDEDPSRKGTNITVSKKQNWAKLPSRSREDKPYCSAQMHSASHRANQSSRGWVHSSGKTPGSDQGLHAELEHAEIASCSRTVSAKSQRTCYSRSELHEDWLSLHRTQGPNKGPRQGISCSEVRLTSHCSPDTEEGTKAALNYTETCTSSSTVKYAGLGAYLQSLDRSSREWVLSSGKAQASEEGLKFAMNCIDELNDEADGGKEGEIWYNPIPEDEDLLGQKEILDSVNPWKKLNVSAKEAESIRSKEDKGGSELVKPLSSDFLTSSGVGMLEEPPKIISENPGPWLIREAQHQISLAGASQANSQQGETSSKEAGTAEKITSCPEVEAGAAGNVSESPNPSKKSSMINRIKSPGTVRKLSMKMKKLPELRRRLSLRTTRSSRQDHAEGNSDSTSPKNSRKESGNVISRYHLDTSVSSRDGHRWPKSTKSSKSVSKGGYLSDGDSPELIAKSDKRSGQPGRDSPPLPSHRTESTKIDMATFRPYSFGDQPRCVQHLSGLLSVHLHGVEDLKSPRVESKEVFCALQVDSVNKARTALLTCKTPFLSLDHTFNIELEKAQHLKLIIFSWDPSIGRNRVCCHGTVILPQLFKGARAHQLSVKLEPRGALYLKLTLVEQWEIPSSTADREPRVFGVELRLLVERENSALKVPLLIQKTVSEIEKRGLKVVGLYRLCGSAAVKKELRDAFERDSAAVTLSEELYPDINVITGILKDYLRELPTPLITRTLYEVVLEAMALRPPRMTSNGLEMDPEYSEQIVTLLDCLPEIEKATLKMLLDHLSLVASFHESNRMNSQNLAVCFGPVLLNQNQDPSRQGGRSFAHCEEIASAVDFKRHIEVLHYLLQLWPNPRWKMGGFKPTEYPKPRNYLRQKRRSPLRLDLTKEEVVSRSHGRRLESPPSNRYAGDWSTCGQEFLLVSSRSLVDADYDEVAATDSENEEETEDMDLGKGFLDQREGLYVGDFDLEDNPEPVDLETPFTTRLNLKEFDALILELEREMAKQINICL